MLFGRSKSLVGLDIGSNSVKAIELKPNGKSYRVTAIGVQPVPPDSIRQLAGLAGAPHRCRSAN